MQTQEADVPGHADASPAGAPSAPVSPVALHAVRIGLLCLGSGLWLGLLAYALQLPFIGDIGPIGGVILSGMFGLGIGTLVAIPVVPLLLRRDLDAARPIIVGLTALVTVAAALTAKRDDPFRVMAWAGSAFIAGALLAWLLLPRRWHKAGLCHHCGYDLRASIEFGRCPECGRGIGERPGHAAGARGASRRRRVVGWAMRHSTYILGVVTILLLAPPIARAVRHLNHQGVFDRAAAGLVPGDVLDFAALPFTWDRMYLFGHYTDPAKLDQALGFPWPQEQRPGLNLVSDSYCFAVFVREERVVAWVLTPPRWNVATEIVARPCTRAEARFLLTKDSEGWYTVLQWAGASAASQPARAPR